LRGRERTIYEEEKHVGMTRGSGEEPNRRDWGVKRLKVGGGVQPFG